MEENENKPVEVTEEAQQDTQGLSREEILAMSRKENKNGDEREAQSYKTGLQLAYGVGMLFLGIVMLVRVILEDKIPADLWICFTAMMATLGLYYGIKTAKYRALFLTMGVLGALSCILFTVMWILELCGVTL